MAELMEQPQILFAEPSPMLAFWRSPKIAREAADEMLAVVIDLNELPAALIAAAVGMFYVTGHKPKLSSPVAGAYERNISSQTRNTQQPDGHSPASISATNEASGELGLPLSNSI
jgi:hypothetical protein